MTGLFHIDFREFQRCLRGLEAYRSDLPTWFKSLDEMKSSTDDKFKKPIYPTQELVDALSKELICLRRKLRSQGKDYKPMTDRANKERNRLISGMKKKQKDMDDFMLDMRAF